MMGAKRLDNWPRCELIEANLFFPRTRDREKKGARERSEMGVETRRDGGGWVPTV